MGVGFFGFGNGCAFVLRFMRNTCFIDWFIDWFKRVTGYG